MASPAQTPTSSTNLTPKNKPSFTFNGDPAVIQCIAENASFPDRNIPIGQIKGAMSAGNSGFTLPGVANTSVNFGIDVSAYACIAEYLNPSGLASDLGFQSDDGKNLNIAFPADPNCRYMVVRWGFDASAQASGKMALTPGVNVTFGGSAATQGLFAFVQTVKPALGAREACLQVLESWCTPAAVANNLSLMPAGTWIVTEVTGQLAANLGIEAGQDFNWVRHEKINGLQGDIGLRIDLALKATLSATLAGKFYLVLNREPETSGIRLRLFRATTKGWGFALDSSVDITPSTGSLTPDGCNDFISAILGIHDAQLLKFLQASDLTEISDALGDEFLKKLDLDGVEQKGFDNLQRLFEKWDNLPNAVTSFVWSKAGNPDVLKNLQNAAKQLTAGSPSSINALLDTWLQDASFHDNPICTWLEAAASKSLFDLYEEKVPSNIQKYANDLQSVLDGSLVQSTLTKVKSQVDSALDLPNLESALSANSLTGVAVWVTQQLARFVGVDMSAVQSNIAKINAAIKTIRDHEQEIYSAVVKALNNTYGFSLSYAYNASSTQSALIDAEFTDAAQADLQSAITGDFSKIFTSQRPGVTVRTASLTHAIQRRTHVETHAPWWDGVADDLAGGFATAKFVDSEGGRLQFYEAGATDTQTMHTNANLRRFANCSIGISGAFQGVRKYNVQAVDFGYTFVTVKSKMTKSQLRYDFSDAASQFFPRVFGSENVNPQRATFGNWTDDLDKCTVAAGDGVIGDAWVCLQVAFRAQESKDWVAELLNSSQAPDYMAMSREMQKSLREWLLKAYSSDPTRFANLPQNNWIGGFLIYTSLPPLNEVRLDQGTLKPNPKGDIVWDTRDLELAQAIVRTYAPAALEQTFANISNLLSGIPSLRSCAKFYDNAGGIVATITNQLQVSGPLITLLQSERTLINDARKSFESLRKAGGSNLQNSLPQFSSALIAMATDFNSSLANLSLASPQVMRLFAPLVFQAAVHAMFPGAATVQADAILDVAVLKPKTLPLSDDPPDREAVLLRQRITSF